MCGRYVIARTPGQLALPFDARVDDSIGEGAEPNWNVAPTHTCLLYTSPSPRD